MTVESICLLKRGYTQKKKKKKKKKEKKKRKKERKNLLSLELNAFLLVQMHFQKGLCRKANKKSQSLFSAHKWRKVYITKTRLF